MDTSFENINARVEEAPQAPQRASAGNAAEKLEGLPRLLRFLGGTILIASAATFMVQEWSDLTHVMRYFSFLVFTLILSGAGFFCGLRLKEDKGARTFLALSAAVIPVHFCQLGALIYSCFPETTVAYPAWLLWKAPSTAAAFGVTAVGLAFLAPIAFIAFSSLARSEALRLTGFYLAANSLLLVPTRLPDTVSLVALALFALVAHFEISYGMKINVLKTREGVFTRIMMWVPLALMALRTLNLYNSSLLFLSVSAACFATFLFIMVPAYVKSEAFAFSAQLASTVPAFFAVALAALGLVDARVIGINSLLPCVVLPYSLVLAGMSLEARRGRAGFRTAAATIASCGMIMELALCPGMLSAFLCLTVGTLVTAYGFTVEKRSSFFSGLICFALGILYYVKSAVQLYSFSPWLLLAILGMAVVFASSFLERNNAYLVRRAQELRKRIASWE